jgi:hypothetical protein
MSRARVTCIFVLLILTSLVCKGDTLAVKTSYVVPLSGGKYVFVMLGPGSSSRDLTEDERRNEAVVNSKYSKSGLYRAGEAAPLWTVDWYAYSVILSDDGQHLVREGPWASTGSDEALTFFVNGKELRSYRIGELCDFPWALPHTVSHFRWLKSMTLDEREHALTVVTLHRDKYVFDLTTGNMTSSRRPARFIIAGIAVVALFLGFLLIRRRR